MTFDGKDEVMQSLSGLNQTRKQLEEATQMLEQMAQEKAAMQQDIQNKQMVIDKTLEYVKRIEPKTAQ